MFKSTYLTLHEATKLVNLRTGTDSGRGPLWAALKEGAIIAEVVSREDLNIWESLNTTWWIDPPLYAWCSTEYTNPSTSQRFGSEVRITRVDVDRLWPEEKQHSAAFEQFPKSKGGRPAVHDWAAAAGVAAHFIVENDYPKSQADLINVMLRWFERERGKSPDKRDVERFVEQIYSSRKTGET